MPVRRLILAAAALGAVLPAPAHAADAGAVQLLAPAPVQAPAADQQTCFARPLLPGARGADVRLLAAPATGVLRARLDGSAHGADWDLAVFGAGGRLLGASAAFGANEIVTAPVLAGEALTVQACRRGGNGPAPALHVDDVVVSGPIPKPETLSLVSIRFRGRRDLDRLLAMGIDLNESARGRRVHAVLHGARDARRLRRAGFSFRTRIADLRADDRRALRSRATASVALPSGRTGYRTLPDYEMDLKRLVETHPGLVRPVVLGTSVEGRTIAGVEIAEGVQRTDDGRPVHVQMGLHHVREWPSGEVVAEFAHELANGAASSDRIASLVRNTRTFLFPVINPDGLVSSQLGGAQTTPSDDDANATLALSAAGAGAYRRKNCAAGPGEDPLLPCAMKSGVDLNRNYGAFWGGPGADDAWSGQTFRGPAPFSEPEAQAVHAWSSAHQVMVLNSNHTFARTFLYQPGFNGKDEPGLPAGTDSELPYAAEMQALSDAMGAAAGYVSMYSYSLYDVTGATEDWNYFAQGAFGYTTEIAWDNFHPNYQDGVIDEYTGTLDGPNNSGNDELQPSQGLREAMLLAGEATADPANHAIIAGTAPAGRTLRLTKDFQTTTSYVEGSDDGVAILIPEHLESSLTVPAGGRYTWHVNPSTRPLEILAGRTEAWTLSCLGADGSVLQTRQVTVGIGQTATADMSCEGGTAAPVTGVSGTPVTGEKATLSILKARRRGRRLTVTLRANVALTDLRATLRTRKGRLRAKKARAALPAGTRRIVLRARRPLRAGRYRLRVTARAGDATLTAKRALRVRRRP